MLSKIFWTILVAIGGFAGMAAITVSIDKIQEFVKNDEGGWWQWLVLIVGLIIAIAPAWFMWKGTDLIPFISNFITRSMTIGVVYLISLVGMILGGLDMTDPAWICNMISASAIVIFSLIGIWLK